MSGQALNPRQVVAPVERNAQARGRRFDVFQAIPYIIFFVLLVSVVLLNPRLLRLSVLETKLNAAFPLLCVTFAQSLIILTGGIDLSIGGILSIATAIAATQMKDDPGSILFWTIAILVIGALAGAINGLVVTKMRVTPFIATLATWSIWGGIALFILPKEGGFVPAVLKTIVQRGGLLGLPKSLYLVVLLALSWQSLKRTRFVTRLYAIGSNRKNAYLSGTPIHSTLIAAYALSGLLASLGGIYRTIQYSAGSPTAGDPFILTSAAAVIMGGMSLAGGRGSIGASLIGAFILLLINDLNYFLGVSTFFTPMVQGVLLILAVAIQSLGNYLRQRRLAR